MKSNPSATRRRRISPELSEDGITNKKIANLLNISETEVKNCLDPETGVILQMPQIG